MSGPESAEDAAWNWLHRDPALRAYIEDRDLHDIGVSLTELLEARDRAVAAQALREAVALAHHATWRRDILARAAALDHEEPA